MSRHARRRGALIIAVLAVFGFAGGAFAFWTAGGVGSSAASVGTSLDIVVKQTSTVAAMHPGDTAQTLSGTFDNPSDGPVYVNTVTASISSVTMASGAAAGTCDASDFTLSPVTATVGASIPKGTSQGSWSGPQIKFNTKATNQDACKGATVNLAYTAS